MPGWRLDSWGEFVEIPLHRSNQWRAWKLINFVMMGLLDNYKEQIQRICKNHKVRTLYSFGSVNTSKFTHESDVDLMVDFETNDPLEYADNYFDLKFALEKILNRKIDLLESKAIKNPFLQATINESKILLYGQ